MHRDSIFYKLFKQFPGLLFEFIEEPPPEGNRYRFDSIEVKETKFRIDGVFIPPDDASSKIVYFAEVQFQKDEELYDRLFAEIALFLRRKAIPCDDWQGVLIFGSRTMEPSNTYLHRSLLNGGQIRRVYLDELNSSAVYPIGVRLMLLTLASEAQAISTARVLIEQAPQEATARLSERDIIDLVVTIMVYKYSDCSWEELVTMLRLDVEEPRAFRELRAKSLKEGREEGRKEEARALVAYLVNLKFGEVPESLQAQINLLSREQLHRLGGALLNFSTLADLETWLSSNSVDG